MFLTMFKKTENIVLTMHISDVFGKKYFKQFEFELKIFLDFSSHLETGENVENFSIFLAKNLVLFSSQKTDLDISLFSSLKNHYILKCN